MFALRRVFLIKVLNLVNAFSVIYENRLGFVVLPFLILRKSLFCNHHIRLCL